MSRSRNVPLVVSRRPKCLTPVRCSGIGALKLFHPHWQRFQLPTLPGFIQGCELRTVGHQHDARELARTGERGCCRSVPFMFTGVAAGTAAAPARTLAGLVAAHAAATPRAAPPSRLGAPPLQTRARLRAALRACSRFALETFPPILPFFLLFCLRVRWLLPTRPWTNALALHVSLRRPPCMPSALYPFATTCRACRRARVYESVYNASPCDFLYSIIDL